MARVRLTRPTTFISAVLIALISTGVILVVMWLTIQFASELFDSTYPDITILVTILVAILVAPAILWLAATRKLGYVWA